MNTLELCRGFLSYDERDGQSFEIHHAVMPDGAVMRCEIPGFTPHFGRARDGRPYQWTRSDALPSGAEFIGNYPAPKTNA